MDQLNTKKNKIPDDRRGEDKLMKNFHIKVNGKYVQDRNGKPCVYTEAEVKERERFMNTMTKYKTEIEEIESKGEQKC